MLKNSIHELRKYSMDINDKKCQEANRDFSRPARACSGDTTHISLE